MGWIRILIDGYSVLHQCPDIAPDRPRHSAAARDELIQRLNRYQDAAQTPVTIVFDGNQPCGKHCRRTLFAGAGSVVLAPRQNRGRPY